MSLLERGEPSDYPASVGATWALNFEQVEKASEASADLLRLSAFLAPDDIPLEVLTRGARELGAPLTAALADAQTDPLVPAVILAPLARYSLIERDVGESSYRVHRLVQEVVRDSLVKSDRRRWAERAVRGLERAFSDVEFESWPLCERLLPHALAAARWIAMYRLEFAAAGRLLCQMGLYSKLRARYSEAEPLFGLALENLEKTLGPGHPHVAITVNNLAEL